MVNGPASAMVMPHVDRSAKIAAYDVRTLPMNPFARLFRRHAATHGSRDRATHDDVYYCYRLILRREPDPAGAAFWAQQVDEQHVSLDFLIDRFLESEEFLNSSFARTLASGAGLKLVEVGDFRIYVRGHDFGVGAALQRNRVWEPHVVAEMRRVLRPGGVLLDLGAGIGYFTLLGASIVGASGQVLAFEPEPGNFGLLTLSVKENAFENVNAYPYAASNRAGNVILGANLQIGERPPVSGSGDDTPPPAADTGTHLVQTVVLDTFVGDLRRLDLIKMDIEGAEPLALDGMRTLVLKHRPVILTEFFPGAIQRVSRRPPEAYLDQLRDLGYDLFVNGAPVSNTDLLTHPDLEARLMVDVVAQPRSG